MMNFNVRIGYGYFILYRKNLFAKIYWEGKKNNRV